MKRVFVVSDWYPPAYKAGGVMISLSRVVARMSAQIDFSIFTRDRDIHETEPFADVPLNEWTTWSGVRVFYASPDKINAKGLLEAIHEVKPEVIYLNSYFSVMTRAVLTMRRRGLLGNVSLVLAPHGEFSLGALVQKSLRKRIYLKVARSLGMHEGILWHAAGEPEKTDIQREIGERTPVVVAPPDVPRASSDVLHSRPPKSPGAARFAFISRISPKKNLLGAIEMLGKVRGEVTYSVYGPEEDPIYWQRCQNAINTLPPNVRVDVLGPIAPSEVHERLAREQFFLFPTLGENFGHVIVEALSAGLPVLLSDQTPWLDLQERRAGWVMPLDDDTQWSERVQACVDMDAGAYSAASQAAIDYILSFASTGDGPDPNRVLFGLDA